jgi:hypothetical protein
MPLFTPPTVKQSSDDPFFGRYSTDVGQSVVKVNGVFTTLPFPWLGEIATLAEGEEWFQGGRTYVVSDDIASELTAAGYQIG